MQDHQSGGHGEPSFIRSPLQAAAILLAGFIAVNLVVGALFHALAPATAHAASGDAGARAYAASSTRAQPLDKYQGVASAHAPVDTLTDRTCATTANDEPRCTYE
ncbi:MAG TPA: hypothetical protein VMV45_05725 [Casimicrobiaceae bacterium]|nr:hypothetical protein [Casimicrobiaceae bacterium]